MTPLARKQQSSQEDWLAALAHFRTAPDLPRAQRAVEAAAERVRAETAGRHAVVGWSAGKDSLALEVVTRAAGLGELVLVTAGRELEYPSFLTWAREHAPEGLHIEEREVLSLDWLREHPEMLFPQDSSTAARWFRLTQHAGQRAYMKRTGADTLVMGRRTADGNFCGPVRDSGARGYTDRGGFERLCPIWDWSHEETLNVLAAYEVPLPELYGWPDGFRVGTGPWPARQYTGSRENGWQEVLGIDRSVVELAAGAGIPGAAEALRSAQAGA